MGATAESHVPATHSRWGLIEAAYDLLGDEGCPAFTADRVTQKAGRKPQLAHAQAEDLITGLLDRFDPLGEAGTLPEPLRMES